MIGIPVTGGNVSFYNQTGTTPIHPTPVVGVLGVLENVADRVPMGLRADGDILLLLGETREELSGSEWASVVHGHLGGRPPKVFLGREKALGDVISTAAAHGHLAAAHDISDGGLAQTLVESCLRHDVGARIALPDGISPFVAMFSESTARALVAVPRGHDRAFTTLCDEHNVPWTALGVATKNGQLEIRDQFTVSLAELRSAWSATLPKYFGGVAARQEAVAEVGEVASAIGPVDDAVVDGALDVSTPDTGPAAEADGTAYAETAHVETAALSSDEPVDPSTDQP